MLRLDDTIYVFHYSKNVPLRFIILAEVGSNSIIAINPDKAGLSGFNLFDPLVICLASDGEITALGGYILEINLKNSSMEIKMDSADPTWQGKRQYERNPASLCADIRSKSISKRCFALIKDISYSGMLIHCKSNITENEEFDMDLYSDKQVIPIKAKILRTRSCTQYLEYGLQIVYSSYASMEAMKQFVESLKDFQKSSVKKFEAIAN